MCNFHAPTQDSAGGSVKTKPDLQDASGKTDRWQASGEETCGERC